MIVRLIFCCLFASPAIAADSLEPQRSLLLVCGLTGDEEHRQRMTSACEKIIKSAEPVLDIPAHRVFVLAADEKMQSSLASICPSVGVTTRDSVGQTLQEHSEKSNEDEEFWIIMVGHAFLYDSRCQLNVQGPDFDQTDFTQWVKALPAKRQVLWLTMPVSGFWTKPLAVDSRVVITATEPDLEYTATEMPYALADILAGEGEYAALEDVDGDAAITLLDLYLAVNLEIHGRFQGIDRLQTEHAQLDDNGDGRGSELQADFLPKEPSEDDTSPAVENVTSEVDANSDSESETDSEATINSEALTNQDTNTAATPSAPDKPQPFTNPALDGFISRQILLQQKPKESS